MRPIAELDALPVHQWTAEEAHAHLRHVFDHACKHFPDLLEPYVTRLGELSGDRREDEIPIMRAGLRETFKQRWPWMEKQQ
jgi:hypothetical protein